MTGLVFFLFGDSAIVGLQTELNRFPVRCHEARCPVALGGWARPRDPLYSPPGEENDIKGQFWPELMDGNARLFVP